jgi:hypothetical protein
MTICTLEEIKRRVRRHKKIASDMNHTQRQQAECADAQKYHAN